MKQSTLLKELTAGKIGNMFAMEHKNKKNLKTEVNLHVKCITGKFESLLRKRNRVELLLFQFNPDKKVKNTKKLEQRTNYVNALEKKIDTYTQEIEGYKNNKQLLVEQKEIIFSY